MTEGMRKILEESPKGEIWVCLDGSMEYNAIDLKSFNKALRDGNKKIITPLCYAMNNELCLRGYKLYVINHFNGEEQKLCINDLLLGKEKDGQKSLRPAHNIERLILSGEYDIRIDWENEDYEK